VAAPAYTMGMVTACIAGLMITISCEELIPASPGGSDRLSAMPSLMAGVILVLVLRQLLG
jgi:zinc transporter ZupT